MSDKFDFSALQRGFEADWPVTVGVPLDGGGFAEQTFMARFRTPKPEEQEELDAIENLGERMQRAVDICFIGLAKSEGETLTPELRRHMMSANNVYLALTKAISEFRNGAARKN